MALADVPTSEGGQSSGIQSTFRQLGSALGIAALTTVFYSAPGGRLQSRLTDAAYRALGSCLAAAFLVVGVVATLLRPDGRSSPPERSSQDLPRAGDTSYGRS